MSPTYCANDDFRSLGDTPNTPLFNIFTNILYEYDTLIWYTNTIDIYCTNNDLGQDKPSPALTSAPVSITMILTHTPNIYICKFALFYKIFHTFKIYTLKNTITKHVSYVHVMTWGPWLFSKVITQRRHKEMSFSWKVFKKIVLGTI